MNCNCIKEMAAKIAAAPFIQSKAGQNISVECQATGFLMDDELGMRQVVNIPYRVCGTGKGYSSAKGKDMPVVASFCPFCGRSTKRYQVGEYDGLTAVA